MFGDSRPLTAICASLLVTHHTTLWALCSHAAVQSETQFQGHLNVSFQCRGMVGSRTQRMPAPRPYLQNSADAASVNLGSLQTFAASISNVHFQTFDAFTSKPPEWIWWVFKLTTAFGMQTLPK